MRGDAATSPEPPAAASERTAWAVVADFGPIAACAWACVGTLLLYLLVRRCCYRTGAPRAARVKVLAVFGSGGHTSELLSLLGALPPSRYAPRVYARAATDSTSEARARAPGAVPRGARFAELPRAREVGQPLWSAASVWGTLRGALAAARLLASERPGLVLVNGPGTCLPVCAAAVALRTLGMLSASTRVVFVESVCRCESLSLSGWLAYHGRLADALAVQHAALAARYPRTHFVGPVL